MSEQEYIVKVGYGDDHLRTYVVKADSPEQAEGIAVEHAASLLSIAVEEGATRDDYDEDDIDSEL